MGGGCTPDCAPVRAVLETVRMTSIGGWTGDGGAWPAVAFLVATCAAGLLERVQDRLRASEGRAWWASNGRDVVNVVALGCVSAGLRVYGFRGALVVCLAGTLVLLLSISQMRLESRPRSTLWSVLVALGLGLPVLVAPAAVASGFERLLVALGP